MKIILGVEVHIWLDAWAQLSNHSQVTNQCRKFIDSLATSPLNSGF